jgi:hypothetical protein
MLTVVINEFHFNHDDPLYEVEFIELHNTGGNTVDLSNWRIDEAVDFEFPQGSTIAPGGFVVVTQNSVDFQAVFGFVPLGEWETGDRLSNEGETIELYDSSGQLVDTVSYQQGFPWPTSGDFGSSVELINPAFDNSLAGNWRSSGLTSNSATPSVLVASNSVWRYRPGIQQNPPAGWNSLAFNEAADPVSWANGATSIGFGDNDDATVLANMQGNYSTFYARREFTISDAVPDTLRLRLYVDDGAIVYINGQEVLRSHVTPGDRNFNSTSGVNHEADWEEFQLTGASAYLTMGVNVVAVHVLNQSINSSDVSFNLELSLPAAQIGPPTPGAQNSVYSTNAAPLLSGLQQSVSQPSAGQDVVISIHVADSHGVDRVDLEYQRVLPGSYIRLTDANYQSSWTTLAMRDDGQAGDAVAGDGVYSVTLPGSINTHRSVVRYRITAEDTLGATVRGPYADDAQSNFAYFVYDGIPAWSGASRPGVSPVVEFDTNITQSIEPYHIIANSTDITNSQYNSSFQDTDFYGTLVYEGRVYDHIRFRVRGEYSTFVSGKNKWRISFNRGHEFQARDNYGNLYAEPWRRMNLNANASPWAPHNRGMAGLDEAVSFRLYQLAGGNASNTNYVHFRVIDDAAEAPSNQYGGDMWGLYLAVEHPGGRFINERDLEDGNIYQIEGGQGDSSNQVPNQPADGSDWNTFRNQANSMSAPIEWWRQNVNLEDYYSFDAITRAVSNVDVRPGDNYYAYHSPDGLWQVWPWDLDMMYIAETHQTGATYLSTYFSNARLVPQLEVEFSNRAREILDLLFSDSSRTGGQVAQLVDEFARMVNPANGDGTYGLGWAELDEAMWNYNPRTTSSHRGAFYRTPFVDNQRFGGQWTRTLDTADFTGMVNWVIQFMTDTDPDGFAIGDGDQRGYGFNYLQYEAYDPAIPLTPVISYSGDSGFPVDGLQFTSSAYSSPISRSFAGMQWRIAEISNPGTPLFDPSAPWLYEIDSVVWESGLLNEFNESIDVDPGYLQPGHTYRARVRMYDVNGRFSHWSSPLEFVAGEAVETLTLAISELNYHPLNPTLLDESDQEFIEIHNYGSEPIDLTGVQIADFASTPYTFAPGIVLDAGGYIIVARDPAVFTSIYGQGLNVASDGYASANLSNGGETVTLLSASGNPIFSVTYDDSAPWPTSPDGSGYSLEIVDPQGDANDPTNWRASSQFGGSPGASGEFDPLPGDYDRNGTVEQHDYAIWRMSFGSTVGIPLAGADGNGDGVVDAADYTIWRDNLGNVQSMSAAAASSLAASFNSGADGPGESMSEGTSGNGARAMRPPVPLGVSPVVWSSSADSVAPMPAGRSAPVARASRPAMPAATVYTDVPIDLFDAAFARLEPIVPSQYSQVSDSLESPDQVVDHQVHISQAWADWDDESHVAVRRQR